MKKPYFNDGFRHFFMDLAAHNNKDWFDANKKRYTADVKAPFEAFVTHLIDQLRDSEKLGDLRASDCIFRIHKDVRFSKDKTPYKLMATALIARGGRKNMHEAGLYVELGPEFVHVYTGFYMPEKEQLLALRKTVAANPGKLDKILAAKDFKQFFAEVKGEKSKILPAEVKALAGAHPLVYNKQFYLQHTADADIISSPDFPDYVLKVYKAAAEFNAFMS